MLALHHDGPEATSGSPHATADASDRTQPERAILCAACGGPITSPRHRTTVNGAHEHRFMNPGGYLFHIGCFSEAVGCAVIGPASLEYPWFPGHAWRIAACGHCRVQLGWDFRAEGSAFFGLILSRLQHAGRDA